MQTEGISTNLASVAARLANDPEFAGRLQQNPGAVTAEELEDLLPDELAALQAFLSAEAPVEALCANQDDPPIPGPWLVV